MSVSVEYEYGAFGPVGPNWLDSYGVTDNKYGVIADPEPADLAYLLCENNDFLVQENGGKIVL